MASYGAVIAAVCTWGTWPLWLHAIGAPPITKAFWSLAFIAALGAPFAVPAWRRGPRPTREDLRLLTGMGAAVAMNQATYFLALERTAVARAALAHYLAPVLVAILAPLVLGERRERRAPLALACALGGLGLLFSEGASAGGESDAAGIALALVSAVFYAATVLQGKALSPGLSPLLNVPLHCGLAALLLLPYAAVTAGVAMRAEDFGWLALASLVAGLGATAAFYRGLARVPAQHAAVLAYLEPVVSAMLAWLLLAQPLGPTALAGGALVVGAGVLVLWR